MSKILLSTEQMAQAVQMHVDSPNIEPLLRSKSLSIGHLSCDIPNESLAQSALSGRAQG